MTEEQWSSGTDLGPMLAFLEGRASERKLRLFGVACCRRVWHLMTDPRHREAVEAAERFADGRLSEAQLNEAFQPIIAQWAALSNTQEWGVSRYMTAAVRHVDSGGAASYAASFAARGLASQVGQKDSPEWIAAWDAEETAQCELLRSLFGDPFRPFQFDADWLSGEGRVAVECARKIDHEGTFEALAALADVLEQTGCGDRAVLEFCRGPGPHVRGCWVVDALLERETAVRTGLITEADWRQCGDPETLRHFLRDKGSNRKWRLFAVACCRRISHLMADQRSRRAVEVAARYADGAATEEELEAARSAAQEAQEEAKSAEYTAEAEADFSITPEYATACYRLYAAAAARSAVCRDPRVTDAEPGSYHASRWRPSDRLAAAAVHDKVYEDFRYSPGGKWLKEADRVADPVGEAEQRVHCDILRDLFGVYLGPPGEEGAWLPYGLIAIRGMPQTEEWCRLPTLRNVRVGRECLGWNRSAIPRMAQAIYDQEAFDSLPVLADALEEAGCDDCALLAHLRDSGPHFRGCWALDALLGRE